jgi:hypothetical protein
VTGLLTSATEPPPNGPAEDAVDARLDVHCRFECQSRRSHSARHPELAEDLATRGLVAAADRIARGVLFVVGDAARSASLALYLASLAAQLTPMVLVAYITTMLSSDTRRARCCASAQSANTSVTLTALQMPSPGWKCAVHEGVGGVMMLAFKRRPPHHPLRSEQYGL